MLSFLKNSFLNEYQRWVLWLPVFQACGIITYFALHNEPSTFAAIGLLISSAILLRAFWRRGILRVVFMALLFFTIGFSAAKFRAEIVNAPKIQKQTYFTLSGNVEQIDFINNYPRLLLNNLRIDDLKPEEIPAKIRLTVRTKIKGDLLPGDRVITSAILLPPPAAVMPNSYDFSRWAYFQGIGATGFPVQTVVKLKDGGVENWLQELRFKITNFIKAQADDDQSGAVSAALITGDRGAISKETNQAMRNSGLAHILSISGLHMSLVAGFFFVLIRYGLGFIGCFSERINIKKLAAIIALFGSGFYLLVSGMPSPAARSFLMIFLLLLAVLIDRTPTPMRSIAFAAFILMLLTPEQVLNPGFQMSFMAVIALIAIYEIISKKLARLFYYNGESKFKGGLQKIITYPIGIVITSLFAGLATTPYAAYHFNQYAAYGLLANLIAMPLASFWIMPMAVFAAILAPFGLAEYPIYLMSIGVEELIKAGVFVSSLDGAAGIWKSFSAENLAIITFGMLWLMLWQTRWRIFGLLPIFAGVYFAMQTPLPDIIIKENGKLWAVDFPDGLHITNRRKTFASQQWYKSSGQKDFLPLKRQDVYEVGGKTVSFNCQDADLIFDLVKPRGKKKLEAKPCDKKLFLTIDELLKNGTHTIYIENGNIRTENVKQFVGDRLWTK